MKFYLSSYKTGNEPEKLKDLFSDNKKVGYIANALDSEKNTTDWLAEHIQKDMKLLQDIGLEVELIDLKQFFGKHDDLSLKMSELGGIWISGGNTFVLRQAMRLSGLDEILKNMKGDFVYGGYSAACCVMSPQLDPYQIVDDPNDFPYQEQSETIWEGLNLIDYAFLPHFDSDHPESEDVGKEIQYCIENKIPHKAFRDGEVLIF